MSVFLGKKPKSPASGEIPSGGKSCVDFAPAVRGILGDWLAEDEALSLGDLLQSLREVLQPPCGGGGQLLTP